MPKIERIAQQIEKFEGFSVRITHKSRSARASYPAYDFERIARNSFTVDDWRRKRFDEQYPDHTVEVLLANGRVAGPRIAIEKIRRTYQKA